MSELIWVRVAEEAVKVGCTGVGGLIREDKNEVVLTLPARLVLGIGGNYHVPPSSVSRQYMMIKAFDVNEWDAKVSSDVLWLYVEETRNRLYPAIGRILPPLDSLSLDLWLPGYEHLSVEQRLDFEFEVLEKARLESFQINGQAVGWPRWQRRRLRLARLFADMCAYAGVLLVGWAPAVRWMSNVLAESAVAFLQLIVLLVVLAVLLVIVTGVVSFLGWTLVAKLAFPSTLTKRYVSTHTWAGVPRWLVGSLWGDARKKAAT